MQEEGEEERWGDPLTLILYLDPAPLTSILTSVYLINHKRLCAGTFRIR